MAEKCCYDEIIMNFFGGEEKMKTREDESMFKLDFIYLFIYSQNFPFWAYIFKKSTHLFLGAWSFLLVHMWFTPSEEPQGFVIFF